MEKTLEKNIQLLKDYKDQLRKGQEMIDHNKKDCDTLTTRIKHFSRARLVCVLLGVASLISTPFCLSNALFLFPMILLVISSVGCMITTYSNYNDKKIISILIDHTKGTEKRMDDLAKEIKKLKDQIEYQEKKEKAQKVHTFILYSKGDNLSSKEKDTTTTIEDLISLGNNESDLIQ